MTRNSCLAVFLKMFELIFSASFLIDFMRFTVHDFVDLLGFLELKVSFEEIIILPENRIVLEHLDVQIRRYK